MAGPDTTPKTTPEPPPLQLSDWGVRWSREGARLRIQRGGSIASILAGSVVPGLAFVVVAAIAYVSLRDGDLLVGGFMAFALVLPGGMLAMRLTHQAEIEVDADGVRWRQERPRRTEGHWGRERIDGLRVHIHPKSRFLEPRQGHVELRVDGVWSTFVFSGRSRRAERLAEDVAMVTGIVPDRLEMED